jgi:hypothetical protein
LMVFGFWFLVKSSPTGNSLGVDVLSLPLKKGDLGGFQEVI